MISLRPTLAILSSSLSIIWASSTLMQFIKVYNSTKRVPPELSSIPESAWLNSRYEDLVYYGSSFVSQLISTFAIFLLTRRAAIGRWWDKFDRDWFRTSGQLMTGTAFWVTWSVFGNLLGRLGLIFDGGSPSRVLLQWDLLDLVKVTLSNCTTAMVFHLINLKIRKKFLIIPIFSVYLIIMSIACREAQIFWISRNRKLETQTFPRVSKYLDKIKFPKDQVIIGGPNDYDYAGGIFKEVLILPSTTDEGMVLAAAIHATTPRTNKKWLIPYYSLASHKIVSAIITAGVTDNFVINEAFGIEPATPMGILAISDYLHSLLRYFTDPIWLWLDRQMVTQADQRVKQKKQAKTLTLMIENILNVGEYDINGLYLVLNCPTPPAASRLDNLQGGDHTGRVKSTPKTKK